MLRSFLPLCAYFGGCTDASVSCVCVSSPLQPRFYTSAGKNLLLRVCNSKCGDLRMQLCSISWPPIVRWLFYDRSL